MGAFLLLAFIVRVALADTGGDTQRSTTICRSRLSRCRCAGRPPPAGPPGLSSGNAIGGTETSPEATNPLGDKKTTPVGPPTRLAASSSFRPCVQSMSA